MPLSVETVDLDAERERLRAEMEETAEEQAEWATGDHSNGSIEYVQQLQSRGTTLQEYRAILEKAQNGDLEDLPAFESVTLAGLSPGDVNRAEDFADDNPDVRFRDAFVAIGTHDAPWLAHDPESVRDDDYEATVLNIVDDVPLPLVRWAEEYIGELSHLGGEMGNEYTKLLLEKAAAMAEADGNG